MLLLHGLTLRASRSLKHTVYQRRMLHNRFSFAVEHGLKWTKLAPRQRAELSPCPSHSVVDDLTNLVFARFVFPEAPPCTQFKECTNAGIPAA